MRVVVDTNVLVGAALKDKSFPAIAVRLVEQSHVLLKSTATEQQLFDVLARPYLKRLIATATNDWLRSLLAAAEVVPITNRINECRDPTDDKFLELAVNGHADIILTGDADLLVLNPFRGIPIVSPVHFVGNAPR